MFGNSVETPDLYNNDSNFRNRPLIKIRIRIINFINAHYPFFLGQGKACRFSYLSTESDIILICKIGGT